MILTLNPAKLYIRLAVIFATNTLLYNRLIFKFEGSFWGISGKVENPGISDTVSIFFICLSALCLILFFLERNHPNLSLESIFRFMSHNVEGDLVKGDKLGGDKVAGDKFEGDKIAGDKVVGPTINIENLVINVGDDREHNLGEIHEINELVQREDELNNLIKNGNNTDEEIKSYKAELNAMQRTLVEKKDAVLLLAEKIRKIQEKYPAEAEKTTNFLFNSSYQRAKDYYIDLMDRKRDEIYAEIIGLSPEELAEIEYEIETGHETDGMVYYYNMFIDKDSALPEIIAKINREVEDYGDSYCVQIESYEVQDEPDDEFDYDSEYN